MPDPAPPSPAPPLRRALVRGGRAGLIAAVLTVGAWAAWEVRRSAAELSRPAPAAAPTADAVRIDPVPPVGPGRWVFADLTAPAAVTGGQAPGAGHAVTIDAAGRPAPVLPHAPALPHEMALADLARRFGLPAPGSADEPAAAAPAETVSAPLVPLPPGGRVVAERRDLGGGVRAQFVTLPPGGSVREEAGSLPPALRAAWRRGGWAVRLTHAAGAPAALCERDGAAVLALRPDPAAALILFPAEPAAR